MADKIEKTETRNTYGSDPERGNASPQTTEDLQDRASEGDYRDLLEAINSVNGKEVEGVAILSFRALQLYRIAILQTELTEIQSNVMQRETDVSADDATAIDRLIQTYADAVRNYETLSQDIVYNKSVTYKFLNRRGNIKVTPRDRSRWTSVGASATIGYTLYNEIGPLGFRELDKRRRVNRERRRAYVSRLSMALFGGLALIAPMLVMALHRGLTVNLVTTSVATVVFAIIIAVSASDASGKDVLASTAAYAAVLVVFVGTSLTY